MNTTLVIGLIALAVILVVIGYFLLRKALREQKPEIVKLDENPLDSMIEGYEEDPAQHEAECQQTACDIMEAGNIICEEANKPEPMVELEPTYTVTEELAGKVLAETPKTPEDEIPDTSVVEKETDKISDEDLKKIAKALKPVKKSTEKKRSRKETTNETKKKTEKTVKSGKSTPKKTKPRQNEAVNGKKNKKKPAKKNTKKK